jgi:hypothetical protein
MHMREARPFIIDVGNIASMIMPVANTQHLTQVRCVKPSVPFRTYDHSIGSLQDQAYNEMSLMNSWHRIRTL